SRLRAVCVGSNGIPSAVTHKWIASGAGIPRTKRVINLASRRAEIAYSIYRISNATAECVRRGCVAEARQHALAKSRPVDVHKEKGLVVAVVHFRDRYGATCCKSESIVL